MAPHREVEGDERVRRRRLLWLTAAFLLLSLGGLSCARVFPPAEPPVGPKPTPVIQPPHAPHGLAGQEDCLSCHASEESFVAALQARHPVPVPPGFVGSTEEACRLCHAVEKGHAATRAIPHPLVGMESCLTCHASGVAGITQTPSNHSKYSVEKCADCHSQAQPAPSALTPGQPAPGPTKTAAAIPHGVAGREDCLACHAPARPGVPPLPPDHSGRTNQTCALCHTLAPAAPAAPPSSLPLPATASIPHAMTDCLSCHGKEGLTAALPADHAGLTAGACALCHTR